MNDGNGLYTEPKIEVYGRPACEWCDKAKGLLAAEGYYFKYTNIRSWSKQEWDEWKAKNAPNYNTLPMVFVNDELIGGYNELEKWIYGF